MKIAEDESQRNDFRNILFDLAKDQGAGGSNPLGHAD